MIARIFLKFTFSKKDDGAIEKNGERLQRDQATGHLTAAFKSAKLTKIAPRKPKASGVGGGLPHPSDDDCTESATERKYALLVCCDPIDVPNVGKVDIWTLSLPVVVIMRGNQDCAAQATSLWLNGCGETVGFSVKNALQSVDLELDAEPSRIDALEHDGRRFAAQIRRLHQLERL